jgi:hypothetical protein
MLRAPAWAFLCLLAAADGLLGCGGCDKESGDPVLFQGGAVSASCTEYATGGFTDEYLDFPAGRSVRVEHGLGQTPTEVHSYLAFNRRPLPDSGIGNTAESAGNQVIIEGVNDQYVQVLNDTCEDFYLRLVVSVAEAHETCLGESAAGGSGG